MILRELLTKVGFQVDEKPLDQVNASIAGVKARLDVLAGAEIVRGIFHLAEKFSGFGEQLNSTAAAAGTSVEELQKLTYAATQNAVSQEELTGAMAKLTANMFEARNGSKEANEAFSALGISPQQVAGFKNSSDALRVVSDSLKNIQDPFKKQALMQKVLGRGSVNMAQMMSQGGAAFDELGKKAERMGTVLGKDQVDALADLEDTLSTLALQVKTATAAFAAAFAPAIQFVVENISEFIAVNREALAQNYVEWATNVSFAIGYTYGVIEDFVGLIVRWVREHPVLVTNVAKVTAALLGMSAGLSGVTWVVTTLFSPIGKLLGLLQSVWKIGTVVWGPLTTAAAWAGQVVAGLAVQLYTLAASALPAVGAAIARFGLMLSATPVGLLIAGIVTLTVGLHDLWLLLTGHDFSETWIGGAAAKIMEAYQALKKFMGLASQDTGPGADKRAELDGITRSQASMEGDQPPLALASMAQRNLMDADARIRQMPALDLVPLSPPAPANAAAGANSVTFDAPITINVPPGADGQAVALAAKDGVREHLDQMLRDARIGTLNPVRY